MFYCFLCGRLLFLPYQKKDCSILLLVIGKQMTLPETWLIKSKSQRVPARIPISVRLHPAVDCAIQNALEKYPNLTQSRLINDLLHDGLKKLDLL